MYRLHSDEKVWQETTYDEEMKCLNGGRVTDIADDEVSYHWITAIGEDERDEVLKVSDFVQGEEVVKKLGNGDLEDFEEAEEQYEYAKIRDERPPQ